VGSATPVLPASPNPYAPRVTPRGACASPEGTPAPIAMPAWPGPTIGTGASPTFPLLAYAIHRTRRVPASAGGFGGASCPRRRTRPDSGDAGMGYSVSRGVAPGRPLSPTPPDEVLGRSEQHHVRCHQSWARYRVRRVHLTRPAPAGVRRRPGVPPRVAELGRGSGDARGGGSAPPEVLLRPQSPSQGQDPVRSSEPEHLLRCH
jgi:hypothetical protein